MPRFALSKRNQAEQQEQAENKNFPGSHRSVFLSALGVVDGNLRTSRPEVLGHYRQVKPCKKRDMMRQIIRPCIMVATDAFEISFGWNRVEVLPLQGKSFMGSFIAVESQYPRARKSESQSVQESSTWS